MGVHFLFKSHCWVCCPIWNTAPKNAKVCLGYFIFAHTAIPCHTWLNHKRDTTNDYCTLSILHVNEHTISPTLLHLHYSTKPIYYSTYTYLLRYLHLLCSFMYMCSPLYILSYNWTIWIQHHYNLLFSLYNKDTNIALSTSPFEVRKNLALKLFGLNT